MPDNVAVSWTIPAAAVTFLTLAMLEVSRPRQVAGPFLLRWLTNCGLFCIAVLAIAAVSPQHFGALLVGGWTPGPLALLEPRLGSWAALALGLILLDAMMYALHRMQHLALFWRFHLVHHADLNVDVSTAFRHHPVEPLVNGLVSGVVLVLAGMPPWIVPIYGSANALFDFWTHANLALPHRLERIIGLIVVTPGIHAVHHSADTHHFNTNFGAILTVWDRAFRTFHPISPSPLQFGVSGIGSQNLGQALLAPLRPL